MIHESVQTRGIVRVPNLDCGVAARRCQSVAAEFESEQKSRDDDDDNGDDNNDNNDDGYDDFQSLRNKIYLFNKKITKLTSPLQMDKVLKTQKNATDICSCCIMMPWRSFQT